MGCSTLDNSETNQAWNSIAYLADEVVGFIPRQETLQQVKLRRG